MTKKTKKSKPARQKKKSAKKARTGTSNKKVRPRVQTDSRLKESRIIIIAGQSTTVLETPKDQSVFEIDPADIHGDTTIGDLIVAFPRTRQVLLKHGISFDVEEAGYVYMTLSVFSALHGLKTNSLIDELVTVSKEVPVQESQTPTSVPTPPAV
ncbi:MAG TPA: hypothetical protein VFE98_00455 [Candidatus Bathyarchaeia archaeon]|nr:hypothetical protein [Candidatus Bathyarchaeia archaeon]